MSLVLAAALAASTVTLPVCSWDRPGVNVFKGDTVAAVDRYADIPAPTRAKLRQRMAARQYDEVASIRRDSIEGRHRYTDLRDMHFGTGQVCRSVTRGKWSDNAVERGLVYCEDGHCLIVPTVCRNVSRVTRLPASPPAAAATSGAGGGDAGTAAAAQDELPFDAPGAGPVAGGSPTRAGAGGWSSPTAVTGSGPSFSNLSTPSPAGGFSQPAWVAGGPLLSASGERGVGAVPEREYSANRPPDPLEDLFAKPPPGLSPLSPTTPVPEPSTYALMAMGLAALLIAARRRRSMHAPARR